MNMPARNDADAGIGRRIEAVPSCPDGNLVATVDEHAKAIARGTRHMTRRMATVEAEMRRERELGLQTRLLIGEREMRLCDMLKQISAMARVFADGLDELVAEW